MAVKGWEWLAISGMAGNGWKLLGIAGNDWKWLKMSGNGWKQLKILQIDEIAENGWK